MKHSFSLPSEGLALWGVEQSPLGAVERLGRVIDDGSKEATGSLSGRCQYEVVRQSGCFAVQNIDFQYEVVRQSGCFAVQNIDFQYEVVRQSGCFAVQNSLPERIFPVQNIHFQYEIVSQ
jgi:hypothetical protein